MLRENMLLLNGAELRSAIYQSMASQLLQFTSGDVVALVLSMVFGNDSWLRPAQQLTFEITGMQHVLVASGSNVGLVVTMVHSLSKVLKAPNWASDGFALWAVLAYAWMVGKEPSIIRAVGMFYYSMLCKWQGRRYSPLMALAVVTGVLAMIDVSIVSSLGYQLSALATIGIVYISPIIAEPGWLTMLETFQAPAKTKSGHFYLIWQTFQEGLVMTLSANLLVSPLILLKFGRLNLGSILINAYTNWLIPLVSYAGIGLVGLIPFLYIPGLKPVVYGTGVSLAVLVKFFQWLLDHSRWSEAFTYQFSVSQGVVYLWWSGVMLVTTLLHLTRRRQLRA